MSKLFKLLFEAPDKNSPGNITDSKKTTEDVLLEPDESENKDEPLKLEEEKKEDKKEEIKDENDDKEEEEEEVDELKEIEEELEGPKDEDLELKLPVSRREVLKKYPTLFKDFPALQTSLYRDRAFTEVFATPSEAKEAAEGIEVLQSFEKDLGNGNIEPIFEAALKSDKNTYYKIIDNLLPTLAKLDERGYHHIIGKITLETVKSMYRHGEKLNNEDMKNAAAMLNEFVFGTTDVPKLGKLSSEDKPEEKKSSREDEFLKKQFERTQVEVKTKVENRIKATIEANIDPKNSMTPFVKRAATEEVLRKTIELISKDKDLMRVVSLGWQKAARNDFSESSLDAIKTAILSRAKQVLPTLLKSARAEALKGLKVEKEKEEKEEKEERPRRREKPDNEEVPKRMSTLEFLNQD